MTSGTHTPQECPHYTVTLMKETDNKNSFAVGKCNLSLPHLWKSGMGTTALAYSSWTEKKKSSFSYFLKLNQKSCQIAWIPMCIYQIKILIHCPSLEQAAGYYNLPIVCSHLSITEIVMHVSQRFWESDKDFWLLINSAAQFTRPEGYFKTKLPWNTII